MGSYYFKLLSIRTNGFRGFETVLFLKFAPSTFYMLVQSFASPFLSIKLHKRLFFLDLGIYFYSYNCSTIPDKLLLDLVEMVLTSSRMLTYLGPT